MLIAERLLDGALEAYDSLTPAPPPDIPPDRCPTVFVHGFLGWGERDALNAALPYWGLGCGDIPAWLRSLGYRCAAASLGPVSSAWDRACELYAQLTGTRTDYGAAHSEKYGHARFGLSYEEPLAGLWDDSHPLDLIAHSFGGNTARLFMDILVNGRPEELTRGDSPSPFFQGGKQGLVRSLTTLASPHNGTTLMYSDGDLAKSLVALFSAFAKALGVSQLRGVCDYKLDQFGFMRLEGESLGEAAERALAADFLDHGDNALTDLTVDACMEANGRLSTLPEVYYFSRAACRTHQSLLSYDQLPDAGMTPLLSHYALGMGRCRGGDTPAGRPLGRQWQPNDGLVNTVSAMYPTGSPFHICSGGESRFSPGVWNVLPVEHIDHLAMMGGVLNMRRRDTRRLYLDIMRNIDSTY